MYLLITDYLKGKLGVTYVWYVMFQKQKIITVNLGDLWLITDRNSVLDWFDEMYTL